MVGMESLRRILWFTGREDKDARARHLRLFSDRGIRMLYDILKTELGRLLVAQDGKGISRIHFLDSAKRLPSIAGWQQTGEDSLLNEAKRQLSAYFAGALQDFSLPLSLEGTPFQKRVWKALMTIPYGTTWSYKELAAAVGNPAACRAVGNANGKNRVSIIAA